MGTEGYMSFQARIAPAAQEAQRKLARKQIAFQ